MRNNNILKALVVGLLISILSNSPALAMNDGAGGGVTTSEPTALVEPTLWDGNYGDSQWYSKFLNTKPVTSSYQPVIAVIGDGVDESFADFKGRVLPGFNILENKALVKEQFSTFNSGGWFGTALTSILVSNSNGKFLTGIASKAKILPIVVSDYKTLTDVNVSKGIDYAVKAKADYIVFALGYDQYASTEGTTKSCASITKAYNSNVLTFVDVYNSDSLGDYSFKLTDCDKGVKVGSYDYKLGSFNQLVPESKPLFSMPAGNTSIINQGGSYQPFNVWESTSTSPALAAGLYANFTTDHKTSKAVITKNFLKNAIALSSVEYYGAGVVYDYRKVLNLESITKLASENYNPKILNITRSGHEAYNITWAPVGGEVDYYNINSYSYKDGRWAKTVTKVSNTEIRTTIENFDIYSNAFVEVEAIRGKTSIKSMPSYDSYLSKPTDQHTVAPDLAEVSASAVFWDNNGINVKVVTNDSSYAWDLLIIDPYTGDILKKYSVSGSNERTILFEEGSAYRSRVLLVATGIGSRGVDYILMPPHLLSVKVNAAGKEYAAFGGSRTCTNIDNVVCNYKGIIEGDKILIKDANTNQILGSALMRSDGTFSTLIKYPANEFTVLVVSESGESSQIKDSSFFLR